MLDKDTQKLLKLRREKAKELEELEKEINMTLEAYMDKRSSIIERIEEIEKETLKPLQDEVKMLESVIVNFCKDGGIDKYQGNSHIVYEKEDIAFKASDWDEIYKYIDNYKGEFDVHSILKKSLNTTSLKKFVKEQAMCPDGIEQDTYTKYMFRKK